MVLIVFCNGYRGLAFFQALHTTGNCVAGLRPRIASDNLAITYYKVPPLSLTFYIHSPLSFFILSQHYLLLGGTQIQSVPGNFLKSVWVVPATFRSTWVALLLQIEINFKDSSLKY